MKSNLPALLFSSLLLVACSSTESDWSKASSAGTLAAYQQFLMLHPDGAHAQEARARIQSLQDDQAWTLAQNANTQQSLQQYLQQQPNGAHAAEARTRLSDLQRGAAWQQAQARNSAAAYQDFLRQYPQAPEAAQARARLQQLATYQVQLATYHSKSAAERERRQLQARYGKMLHQVVVDTTPNRINEVRSAPMSQADAQLTCAALKRRGQHCQVVASASGSAAS
jgi:hypothetical protein